MAPMTQTPTWYARYHVASALLRAALAVMPPSRYKSELTEVLYALRAKVCAKVIAEEIWKW